MNSSKTKQYAIYTYTRMGIPYFECPSCHRIHKLNEKNFFWCECGAWISMFGYLGDFYIIPNHIWLLNKPNKT
jgi:hypothetical protein